MVSATSKGTPGALAARKATKTIPIVFAGVSDPITVGLVDALTRPGGNVTGVTLDNPELTGKRLSLLKEASLGLEIRVLEARQPQELPQAFDTMTVARIAAVVVLPDPMFVSQRRRITELAATRRIASMYHLRQFVTAGGLLSYGADYTEAFEQSAVLVDKLLRGTRAADLPVEHPWRYSLVINLKTAEALGLTIPPSLLARADQVVE